MGVGPGLGGGGIKLTFENKTFPLGRVFFFFT